MDISNQEMDLVNKYLSGSLSEEENLALLNWISQSKENERFLHQLKDLYEVTSWKKYFKEARTEDGWENLFQHITQGKQPEAEKGIKRLGMSSWFRYAAVFLIGILSSALVSMVYTRMFPQTKEISFTEMVTEKGEKSKLMLPDGTEVWLNSASSIKYSSDYGSKNRNIEMTGEAYFHVKKNQDLPFLVEADGFHVQALGTKFVVSSYRSEKELYAVLLEGKISFEQEKTMEKHILQPHQKITFSKQTKQTKITDEESTDYYINWKNGEIRFQDQTFEDIAQKLERSFNMHIVFENEKIKKTVYTGTFYGYEKVDVILKVFQKNKHFDYQIKKDTIYIK